MDKRNISFPSDDFCRGHKTGYDKGRAINLQKTSAENYMRGYKDGEARGFDKGYDKGFDDARRIYRRCSHGNK